MSVAEGLTRLVPSLFKLPRSGPVGLAVSAATGMVVGMAAEEFLGADVARLATASALAVPLQAAAMQYLAPSLPLLSTAFTPTLGSYPRMRRLASYSGAARNGNGAGGGFDYSTGFAQPGYDYATAAAMA